MHEELQPVGDSASPSADPLPFQALIICNTYKGQYLRELDGPHSDGENVKEWLQQELGDSNRRDMASIYLLKDADGKDMSQEIKTLGDRVKTLKRNGEAPVVRTSGFSN